ncbi:MAG: ABC transporter ATP-binding protein [Micavibrio sp.]|jgi:branched-chain amino acid transport system ATP-binding protein|nr:ABC transporter ATP-binding protein [Micavibrio sp.]|tara:strand:+ start:1332 stop:2099 length:768 start_codon:yes stop_codon:yes gene_type:complete
MPTSSASLRSDDLSIKFGGHIAVNQVSCAFQPGQLTAIVGPNGAGKTTYFNLLSGQLKPTSGRIYKADQEITSWSPAKRAQQGIGRAFQLTNLFPRLSVLENVRLAVQVKSGLGANFWSSVSSYNRLEEKAYTYLDTTHLTKVAKLPAATLPHGDQRKLEVALMLAMEPDIFMFDEPTAGMSAEQAPSVLSLIAKIKENPKCTVLLVEHKLDVVRRLADRIIVLHNGSLIADGKPEQVINLDIVRKVYLGKRGTS